MTITSLISELVRYIQILYKVFHLHLFLVGLWISLRFPFNLLFNILVVLHFNFFVDASTSIFHIPFGLSNQPCPDIATFKHDDFKYNINILPSLPQV